MNKQNKQGQQQFDEPELWDDIENAKIKIADPFLSKNEKTEKEAKKKGSQVISVRLYQPTVDKIREQIEPCKKGLQGGVADWVRSAVFEKLEKSEQINEI